MKLYLSEVCPAPFKVKMLLFVKRYKSFYMDHRYQSRLINIFFFTYAYSVYLGWEFQSKPEPNPVKFIQDTLTDLNGLWRSEML